MRTGISQLRLDAGYTSAKSAAKALKISEIHLYTIERGATGPSEGLLERMAVLYGVRAKDIAHAVDEARAAYHGRMLSS